MRFHLTPLVVGSLILTNLLPTSSASSAPRGGGDTNKPAMCALLAAQITASGFACGLGNVPACLALASALEKFTRECEQGQRGIPPEQGGPTMRPR